jgi:hypothetical protein
MHTGQREIFEVKIFQLSVVWFANFLAYVTKGCIFFIRSFNAVNIT